MVLSYSAIAKPASGEPSIISIATPAATAVTATPSKQNEELPTPGPSTQSLPPVASSSNSSSEKSTIEHLILDAGPLLSLTPLRHLATTFHTTPLVLAELRDPKAREHWERLKLTGVDIRVENPTADSMAKVSAFAKKTGDFAVLSTTDLSVAALTYQYEVLLNGVEGIRTEPGQKKPKKVEEIKEEAEPTNEDAKQDEEREEAQPEHEDIASESDSEEEQDQEGAHGVEEVTQSIEQVLLDSEAPTEQQEEVDVDAPTTTDNTQSADSVIDQSTEDQTQDQEEEDESDGGEWINPANLTTHRSRDLGLITPSGSAAKPPAVACMTGDFAVQNILLGMGLGLVGEGGKKISKVKSWVLRCHACFKICKDSSKRFCPSCGNATLMRTTVTTDSKTGKQSLHLKKNFQYHTRGTIYSIPDPKMGRSKGQVKGGSGLILREDQREWSDAVRHQDIKKEKEERRAAKGVLKGWNDPDWLPEIISVGMSGKGRSGGGGMPSIGHGRKNPNQAKKRR
ncbi:hypothetical protein CI109_107236 [Kwoniella shandongensis]|uniref:20S-pre-rRNA D-site endonuclease NOB1 n=1 Tax=Kwoniella shandongensis TaxID=1734106 RepID=A0A5M6C226_9TREE|nr:uncharacterized protein CI109_002519 [Kwoniella shandongensis]KAA5529178.1 hypothetical protein CI109_002519 [Kwoniella shandongensis]